jgi:hypothetical protein
MVEGSRHGVAGFLRRGRGGKNGGGKRNLGPVALLMGEREGGWSKQEAWGSGRWQSRGRGGGGIRSVRQGTAAHGPAGRSGGGACAAAAVGSAHKNNNLFDLFKGIPKRSDLISIERWTF